MVFRICLPSLLSPTITKGDDNKRDSEKLDLILEKVNTLDEKASNVEVNLQEVKQRVINTDLVIENEIRANML